MLTFLFPTRMMGTLGQKCFTSGVHFSGMFSRESGESARMKMAFRSSGSERRVEKFFLSYFKVIS